jgi:hypothetical protein
MNAWRVPYEAHTSVVGYASEGSACLRRSGYAQAGLNLSPLARLLRHDQLVPLISFQVFITGREMPALFLCRVDNLILRVKIGLA